MHFKILCKLPGSASRRVSDLEPCVLAYNGRMDRLYGYVLGIQVQPLYQALENKNNHDDKKV